MCLQALEGFQRACSITWEEEGSFWFLQRLIRWRDFGFYTKRYRLITPWRRAFFSVEIRIPPIFLLRVRAYAGGKFEIGYRPIARIGASQRATPVPTPVEARKPRDSLPAYPDLAPPCLSILVLKHLPRIRLPFPSSLIGSMSGLPRGCWWT